MDRDIWNEVMTLERRFDDFARELIGSRARVSFPALHDGLRRPFMPAADVFTRGSDMVIRMDLPGIKVEDVKVSVIDGQLVVKGERRQKSEVKDDDYYRMEASYGAFERRFPLGDEVGDDDVKASAATECSRSLCRHRSQSWRPTPKRS